MNITVTLPNGESRTVEINKFPALDGWDIQQRFVEFAASHDKEFRRAYALEILAYASVYVTKDRPMPFVTGAMIDSHLGSWQNVQLVFEEVLTQNGIDPKTHADQPVFWAKAGAEMATSFVSEVTRIFGPAIDFAATKQASE